MSKWGITTSGGKKYNSSFAALQRRSQRKTEGLAIHVRLGRAFEKLGRPSQAIQEYKSGPKLAGPQKWSDEAKAALIRLQPAKGG